MTFRFTARGLTAVCITAGASAILLCSIPSSAASLDEYVPLSVGDKCEYSMTESTAMTLVTAGRTKSTVTGKTGTVVDEVTGVQDEKYKDQTLFRVTVRMHFEMSPSGQVQETVSQSLLAKLPDGLRETASRDSTPQGTLKAVWDKYSPPQFLVKTDAKVGDEWNVGSRCSFGVTNVLRAKIVGFEAVEVPAGRFEKCLKIATWNTKTSGKSDLGDGLVVQPTGTTLKDTTWYAAGIGQVKETIVTDQTFTTKSPGKPSSDGTVHYTRSYELLPDYPVHPAADK